MAVQKKLKKKITVESALKGVTKAARTKAFRNNRPVAVSDNGKTFLLFPDGLKKPLTKELLVDIRNGRI